MTDTRQDKTSMQADVRALRPIGWFMGGVTALCAVMAVVTGCWTQHRARDDFNRTAVLPGISASLASPLKSQVFTIGLSSPRRS